MSDLDEQAEDVRGKGKRESGGGSINEPSEAHDRRVTSFIRWAMGVLGTVLVGISSTAVIVLVGIRDDVRDLKNAQNFITQTNAERNARVDRTLDRHESSIENINGRVYSLEGKALRGGPQRER